MVQLINRGWQSTLAEVAAEESLLVVAPLPSEYVQMGWWQGAMAIDEDGNALEYGEDEAAVAWCLGGAVEAAYFRSPT